MTLTTEQRFWRKVEFSDGCWLWTAALDNHGYGRIGIGKSKVVRAHRLSYELAHGKIPMGLVLDHLCKNRGCVNPAHMEPVEQRMNVLRGTGFAAINATKTHCPRGHEYTPENTVGRPGRAGRWCRECNRERARARRAKKSRAATAVPA